MRNYYHTYPTCPCCHEPHLSGSILKIINEEEGILKCSACNAYFYKDINFTHFPHTWNLIINGDERYNEYIPKLPLLWSINPNIIEEAYLKWFNGNISGKYLITWPWREIKFISLLFSEFAIQNPDKKIVVISNVNDLNHCDNEIHKPDLISLFENLFYSENIEQKFTEDIIEERRRFNRSNVLIQRNRFYYHVKLVKNSLNEAELDIEKDNSVDAQNCTFRKCINGIKKKLDSLYGEDSLRTIKWKENGDWRKKQYNSDDGYFDISLEKYPTWGGRLKFNKLTYWNLITNIDELYRVNMRLSYTSLLKDEDIIDFNYDGTQLFFISDSINPDYIFKAINEINPYLVIFTKVDDFIEDKVVFNGKKGRNFINFVKNTQKNLLMFSVKPDSRHFYRIGKENSFLDKYGVTAHTWDSDAVIENIMDRKTDSYLNNSIYSSSDEIKYQNKINAEYIHLKCLDAIEDIIPKILQIINNDKAKKFFIDLVRSPLYINSDNPRINFSRGDWNFENMMSYIIEADVEAFNEVIDPFKSSYFKNDNPYNPIMDKIVQLLTEYIKIGNSVILIIVPYYDKKGTEQIILENGFQDYISNKIRICTWNELATIDLELESDKEFYVISTISPYITYELHNSPIKTFIFIGSSQNLEKIETIIDNRLNEKNARPLYVPSLKEDCPELLREALKDLHNVEKINNMISELEFEENIRLPEEKKIIELSEGSRTHQMKISAGEEVIIVVDEQENGLFLPLERVISFKNDHNDSIDDIKILKSKINELKGKEIIIDNHGFYASYKLIFTKFVVEMGENTLIKTPLYNWKGFKDLIYSASEWMRLLKKLLVKIQKDEKISESDAKDELASFLVNLNIQANHQDYIKNFWLAEPSIVNTTYGMIQIFEIEHPRSLEDLIEIYEKIGELLPDIKLGTDDARKCYTAARTLQNIRRNFLRGKNISQEYRHLYEKLHEEIKMIVKNSVKFKVVSANTVILNKDIYPFQIIQNYKEYYY